MEEFTARVTQTFLKRNVDTESARKGFELNLSQFGPYTLDYTRNGRSLVLGGRKGKCYMYMLFYYRKKFYDKDICSWAI